MATNSKPQEMTVREHKRPLGLWPDELDRFFDRAMRGFRPRRRFLRGFPALWRAEAWMPDMDVFAREGKTVMRIDLPGMRREDIEVEVQGDTLVIRGHREESGRGEGSQGRALLLRRACHRRVLPRNHPTRGRLGGVDRRDLPGRHPRGGDSQACGDRDAGIDQGASEVSPA